MNRTHGLLSILGAALLATLTQGEWGTNSGSIERLQPFGSVSDGTYIDTAELLTAPEPTPGTRRSQRWQVARESGLEELIVRPQTKRGDYFDCGAEHSAWSAESATMPR